MSTEGEPTPAEPPRTAAGSSPHGHPAPSWHSRPRATPPRSLAPGGDDVAQSRSAATPDDAERTVVVPRRTSDGDEETTVVVDKKPVVDDPERTLVAPKPKESQRVTGAAALDAGHGDQPTESKSDLQDEETLYQQPTVNPRARVPATPTAPTSSQRHGPVLPSSVPLAGQQALSAVPGQSAQRSGFGPQPFGYGQPHPYGYAPAGPYPGPPCGPGAPSGVRRSTLQTALLWGGVGVVAVVLGIALVLGLVDPDLLSAKKLDVQDAQAEVRRVLTDDITGYGAKDVADINCNNGTDVTVKQGNSFTCHVRVDGTARSVTATFLDSSGNFDVSRPD